MLLTDLIDAEVLADVDHPGAQPRGRRGLGLDVVGREPGVAEEVPLDDRAAVLGRVVLVERDERLEELVDGKTRRDEVR
jgi:hypothetical protein